MRHALPVVRVLKAVVPIPIGYSHEIRVELISCDGIRKIRVRAWERVPEAEDVSLHVVAIRQLIASLVASTAPESAARFIIEASEIVGMYLHSRENTPPVRSLDLAIAPSDIVRSLRESGILARFNISEPETIPATLDLGAWVPTDEVLEAENVTDHGWAETVRETDQISRDIHAHSLWR